MPVFIGLDIGSSSVRAAAFDEGLDMLCSSQKLYPMHFPRPGWAEQDPRLILSKAREALAETSRKLDDMGLLGQVKALGASGFMHSTMAVGEDKEPLTMLLPWADQRTAGQVAWIREEFGRKKSYLETGCPTHTTYVPGKIRWLREEMAGITKRTWRYMSVKEWVLAKLTGEYACDLGIASGAGLLDMRSRCWDKLTLTAAGIDGSSLNPLVEPTTVIGGITKEAAETTGLPEGTPVVAGSSDAAMSSLGSGAGGIGETVAMIGTSGAIRMTSDRPMIDDGMKCWCYYLAEDRWIVGGATNNGGNVLDWYRESLTGIKTSQGHSWQVGYDDLLKAAESSPAGSSGLVFLAFLAGERAPGWDENARGVLLGLTLSHTAADVARSILEGTVFQLHGIFEALKSFGEQKGRVIASGGFARSDLWLKILASVLGSEIEVPRSIEGSVAGAAAIAMIGTEEKKGLEWTSRIRKDPMIISPAPEDIERYKRVLRVYRDSYDAMNGIFKELVDIAER